MKMEDKNTELLIMEAAEDLFIKQGFAKTTTAQIAKKAGCNQALVHYYYRTKDNLFDKVCEEKLRFLAAHFLLASAAGTNFEDKVKRMIEAHFEFLKNNTRLVAFLFNEISSNPKRLQLVATKLQQYPQSMLAQLDTDIKVEIDRGSIREISAIDLFLSIVSLNIVPLLASPILQQIYNLPDASVQEMLEQRKTEIIDMVLSRLRK